MSVSSPSPDDQFELASQLAALTSANVPLASGLRALGRDMPRGRTARRVERFADHLERGMPIGQAAAARDVRLPKHLVGLLACGARDNQLAQVLVQFLRHERLRDDLRRSMWSAFAYPMILVIALGLWIFFVAEFLVKDMRAVFEDFEIELPSSTQSLIAVSEHAPKIAAVVIGVTIFAALVVRFGGRSRIAAELIGMLPLLGPLWRYRGAAECTDLLELFLRHDAPLPQALEFTASGLSDGAMAAACRHAGRLAEQGLPLANCVKQVPDFPPTLTPILAWGDRASAPADALAVASEWFRGRCQLHADLLSIIVPPLTFILVTTLMLNVLAALFAPLLQLIRSLT